MTRISEKLYAQDGPPSAASAAASTQPPLRLMLCGQNDTGRATMLAHLQSGEVVAGTTRGLDVLPVACEGQEIHALITGEIVPDAALLLVDARAGVTSGTHHLSQLLRLAGIRQLVVVVNKMDQVGYEEQAFTRVVTDYSAFVRQLGLDHVSFVPVSALQGDNLAGDASRMPWYRGATLLGCLQTLEREDERAAQSPLRLRVMSTGDTAASLRCRVEGGRAREGDRIRAQPAGKESRIAVLLRDGAAVAEAGPGSLVQVTLDDAVPAVPGDLLSAAQSPAGVADQFEAELVWTGEAPLLPGRPYALRLGGQTLQASITDIKYRLHDSTQAHEAAKTLPQNAVAVCNISLSRPVPFDAHAENRQTGGFVLLDGTGLQPVGAGALHFALRRSQNIHMQAVDVDKAARAALKRQHPCILWFTGLSGSGKSTIANMVEKKLNAMGQHTYLLDGDNVRHGLNKDLGFTAADRVENIRRIGEVAKLMVDAGLIVLTAFISPFRAERQLARSLVGQGEFIEVFVDTPLEVAEQRDVKGLYQKARRGEIKNFTGIDSPYERPEQAEVVLASATQSPEQAAEQVLELLRSRGYLQA